MRLRDGSQVAVIGGGPAGSFFAFFLLKIAARAGLRLTLDIYEPRDFAATGPAGCNMCGGVVSESLVQSLAADGINLPTGVVQRGIESYMFHVPEGSVRISPARAERRIAALHRGGGPRGCPRAGWRSFDGYLLDLAEAQGANLVRDRVKSVVFEEGSPCIETAAGIFRRYDLLGAAVGVNSPMLKLLGPLCEGYHPPRTTRANLCEIPLEARRLQESLGNTMHVFLLDLPRVEFAALIPKGECVTACLLGEDVDRSTMLAFLDSPAVRGCFPPGWVPPENACHCAPRLNVGGAARPYGDRIVFIGDCGVTRLYKDGIGAAYRTAKAAATTAVFHGVSAAAFGSGFLRACRAIERDNRLGRSVFTVARSFQHRPLLRKALLDAVAGEQRDPCKRGTVSGALWDVFTGSASYADVVRRLFAPVTIFRLAAGLRGKACGPTSVDERPSVVRARPEDNQVGLGWTYLDGEVIVREGEAGDRMFVIQSGIVEVYRERGGIEMRLALLEEGAIFGEMSLCDAGARSASVRALGPVRAVTVDHAAFLRRVHEDPSLALRVFEQLCRRIRTMNDELAQRGGRSEPRSVMEEYAAAVLPSDKESPLAGASS